MSDAKPALVYDNNAIQRMLAEKHGVPLKNVIKSHTATRWYWTMMRSRKPKQLKGHFNSLPGGSMPPKGGTYDICMASTLDHPRV